MSSMMGWLRSKLTGEEGVGRMGREGRVVGMHLHKR